MVWTRDHITKREEQSLKRTKAATGTREQNKQTKKEIYPCGSAGKESACNARDLGLIPGLGRSLGEEKGYPLQYSGLENSMDSPWDHKESDTTEWLPLPPSGKSQKNVQKDIVISKGVESRFWGLERCWQQSNPRDLEKSFISGHPWGGI